MLSSAIATPLSKTTNPSGKLPSSTSSQPNQLPSLKKPLTQDTLNLRFEGKPQTGVYDPVIENKFYLLMHNLNYPEADPILDKLGIDDVDQRNRLRDWACAQRSVDKKKAREKAYKANCEAAEDWFRNKATAIYDKRPRGGGLNVLKRISYYRKQAPQLDPDSLEEMPADIKRFLHVNTPSSTTAPSEATSSALTTSSEIHDESLEILNKGTGIFADNLRNNRGALSAALLPQLSKDPVKNKLLLKQLGEAMSTKSKNSQDPEKAKRFVDKYYECLNAMPNVSDAELTQKMFDTFVDYSAHQGHSQAGSSSSAQQSHYQTETGEASSSAGALHATHEPTEGYSYPTLHPTNGREITY
jgi:hypothetical protein